MRLSELAGRRVLVLGTGREGLAAARAVVGLASTVTAADDSDGASAAAWRSEWTDGVPLLIAPQPADLLGSVDVVIVSPGIGPRHPLRAAFTAAGIPVTSGSDLWLSQHAASTTAVTGSKGKSTTASLIHHLTGALGGEGASVLGGNIGLPLLDLAPAPRSIVELSSYQCQSLTVSPDVAVLTSLFPEHLDWHGSEEAYYADKLNLIGHGPRHVVINAEDARLVDTVARVHPEVFAEPVGAAGRWGLRVVRGRDWIVRGSEQILPREELALLGRHNALNACLALAAVEAAGLTVEAAAAAKALTAFRPLEHRLEPIADPSGLTFVNDSLSTSPFATIEALKAFPSPALTLLVGGRDRGVDYGPLADYLAAHPVAAVIGLPPSGPRILAELARSGVPGEQAMGMADAVARARASTPAGGTVLLSPAAPSYGIYRDYADRAADFVRAIRASRP